MKKRGRQDDGCSFPLVNSRASYECNNGRGPHGKVQRASGRRKLRNIKSTCLDL